MTTDAPSGSPLSEADIQAYADGTLTPERAAFLRDYLGKDPAEARRVAFYGRLNTQIQQAFQTTDEPVAGRATGWRRAFRRINASKRARRIVNTLAALALTLAVASGWLAATQVSAQALNNAAVMALAESDAGQFSAASPTRADPSAPNLSAIGLRLVDQRVIALGPLQRVSEFIYLNGDNQPVVLLSALALLAPAQPQWSARRIGDIRLLLWTAQRQRFVVAGNARTHGLMRAADAMTMR
ncbi:anti-sigma factor family protein [Paraburkholderia xenovorans]|uniref:anti-sigma factor family protein n=1 Tax=Paraburkholderia xenovorans TaxID=36873 RepID=UPI0015C52BE1|nr:transcriptional regulator [Paraburkholderia xenovorans]NPT36943.1 transcriptional regulator [Paraburkholderia xenovorans]